MAESLFVDVRYQGLALGSRLAMEDFTAGQAYLHHPGPMPVGSDLMVAHGEVEIPVRVSRVSEQVAGAPRPSGMFVIPRELSVDGQAWWDACVAGSQPRVAEGGQTQVMEAAPQKEVADTDVMGAVTSEEVASAEEEKAKGKKKRRRRRRTTRN